MRIALDAMGGDFAPKATVEGAYLAAKYLSPETHLVLIGQEEVIKSIIHTLGELPTNVSIVHAPEVIGMGEHPTKALSQKPQSSISVGFQLLKAKEVEAFCSAGNTGAMHVGALFSVKAIEGISRPALISHVPKLDGSFGVILDVGANVDCKPQVLQQFGLLGTVYAKHVFNIAKPKVVLLNLGEEEQKGNAQTQEAYQLLKADTRLNFVGNMESREMFKPNHADVVVCDGFVGNVLIKMAETYYTILKKKKYSDPFFDNFNYETIGGSPILGINGNVVIGHGISNGLAIQNMILLTEKITKAALAEKIKEQLQTNGAFQ
ncbi:MAG: phosphate acyltransferase PlsX [Microscillaceae bacterium]|nr:phosphate acyltransferase PlsX [Microscillaceae bacterium]MDW8460555.1 phosphate acyltransferase PlsX [Cytophagales bacterium]